VQLGKQPLGDGGAKWDGAEQQGQVGARSGVGGKGQAAASDGAVHQCKACRPSNKAKVGSSHQQPDVQRPVTALGVGAGTGAGCAALTHPLAALHHSAHHSSWR